MVKVNLRNRTPTAGYSFAFMPRYCHTFTNIQVLNAMSCSVYEPNASQALQSSIKIKNAAKQFKLLTNHPKCMCLFYTNVYDILPPITCQTYAAIVLSINQNVSFLPRFHSKKIGLTWQILCQVFVRTCPLG